MPEVEVEVTSSITRWRRAAERVTARGRRSTWPSSLVNCHRVSLIAIESGQRRNVQFVMLLVPNTPKVALSKRWEVPPRAQQALGGATSAQLPNVLAQCAAARWRLTGTARRRRPRRWALN